jgi:alkylation response protein AidB-like acyl-CoA dehydrogenase
MLNLGFSDDHKLLRDSFLRFFEEESSIARVRAAEPLGFDAALQKSLGEMGALGIRTPESAGGSGAGLIDAALVVEAAGRHLASAPLVEGIVAARLLAELGGPAEALEGLLAGETVVTLALKEARAGAAQVVPAGAVAEAVLALEGDEVFLLKRTPKGSAAGNHGSQPIARLVLSGAGAEGERIPVAKGAAARSAFLAGIEEWKLLTAAQLNGLSRRALEYAVDYAKERIQFDRPIGSYQAIAHPLADRAVDVDAAQLFTWWTIQQIAEGKADAAASVNMSYWWSAKTADETTRRAVHTFGGYGVTLEYDLQLYFRRAKAWPLVLGDPQDQLAEAGRRLWLGAQAPLPEAGDPGLDFEFGEEAEALVAETRAILAPFKKTIPRKAAAFRSYEGFEPEIARALGEKGLYHPAWPEEWGGRGAHLYAAAAALAVWEEFQIATHPQGTSHFVGSVIRMFGDEMLKEKVLPAMASGEVNSSLGYSEPGSGSDIFAAKTRAEWDELKQEWVINGQKMFTSGAERTQYIFLLARTDPTAAKHSGITMFLVPTDAPGVEVHPVFTMQEERTNATFYTDVRISDLYRIGEVNGGLKVLGAALVLEQGGSYRPGPHDLVDSAVEWARRPGEGGGARIEEPDVRARIARLKVTCILKELLGKRALFAGVADPARRNALGPMNKLFHSEGLQRDMSDLMDLMAPDTLFEGFGGLGEIEINHRLAQIGTIYGGTSEVQRSTVAEVGLGLPRSR